VANRNAKVTWAHVQTPWARPPIAPTFTPATETDVAQHLTFIGPRQAVVTWAHVRTPYSAPPQDFTLTPATETDASTHVTYIGPRKAQVTWANVTIPWSEPPPRYSLNPATDHSTTRYIGPPYPTYKAAAGLVFLFGDHTEAIVESPSEEPVTTDAAAVFILILN
jgi:hypothetical protein